MVQHSSGRATALRSICQRKTFRRLTMVSPVALGVTADDVDVHCDYIGGGFGSKFPAELLGYRLLLKSRKKTGSPRPSSC